ncbi:MAG: C40 family peptidase [Ruminiclostridium sp.]|nr:C40 family peptidase [Ruminiclostridium sp.]
MGLYTNTGLVKHAEKALALKTKYMWGGILRPVEQQYDMLFKMYGNKAGTGYTAARWNELKQLCNKGYYGVDCVGLIKSYYWSGKADGGTGSPKYGASGYPDANAGFMYQQAKKKGKISTMPEIPGLIVYSKSHPHVGIYIGGGYTIESTLGARGDGVVKRRLDNFWEYWFQCPYIEYPAAAANSGKRTWFNAGDKVYIKNNAKCYAGTNIRIPANMKGSGRCYTVAKILSGRVLLKELYSWVMPEDIGKLK